MQTPFFPIFVIPHVFQETPSLDEEGKDYLALIHIK